MLNYAHTGSSKTVYQTAEQVSQGVQEKIPLKDNNDSDIFAHHILPVN
jgi:hypothetical protein